MNPFHLSRSTVLRGSMKQESLNVMAFTGSGGCSPLHCRQKIRLQFEVGWSWNLEHPEAGDRGLESFLEAQRKELEQKTFPPEFRGRKCQEVVIERSVKQGRRREGYPREGWDTV